MSVARKLEIVPQIQEDFYPSQRSDRYVLLGGDKAESRLKMLNNAYWPTSKILFSLIDLKKNTRFLDIGCGAGFMMRDLAKLVNNEIYLEGVDMDPRVVELAQQAFKELKIKGEVRVADITQDKVSDENSCEYVYTRSVLTHLKAPEKILEKMVDAAKPGGIVIVEDIEFTGSFSYPKCPAYYRFAELYQGAVKLRGADPNIGPKIFKMFKEAGLKDISIHVTQPTFYEGDGKRIAEVTMEHIRKAVVDAKLASNFEINQVIQEISEFASSADTLMSFPRVYQVWGKKSAK